MAGSDNSLQHSSPHGQAHAQFRRALAGYAAAVALGERTSRRFRRLTAHLAGCQACQTELRELLDLAVPAYRGTVPVAEAPQFDLSFLGSAASARQSWAIAITDRLRRLVVEFSEPLLEAMRQARVNQTTRGPVLYHYVPEPALPGTLGLTIDVFGDEQTPDQGSVQVLLDLPEQDPFDQAGTHVTLRIADLVWEGHTSATGAVTFAGVPLRQLAQLRLEVALPSAEPK